MAKKTLYFEIFTTSLGALLLEIAYTRIFSFKVFYYFTYLILGLGLLGIGSGGIAVATSERLRRARPERLIPVAAFLGGALVLLSYLVIGPIQLNIADSVTSASEIGKVVLVALLLTSSFFAVGVVLSTILSGEPDNAQRLYGADLIGAALGCTVCVPLVTAVPPPRIVVLAGFVLACAGLRLARPSRPLFVAGAITSLILLGSAVTGIGASDPVVAKGKAYEDYRNGGAILFSKWSPVFRIDVATHPFHPGEEYLVFHDGQPGSGLRKFDGSFERFKYLDHDSRALPFRVLPKKPKVLVIGAAGGHELVASLYFDVGHVTGVELNPVTYSLLTKVFADVTGHLAENPKITLLNGDGRWFLKQTHEKYDLIWFVAPDSYAAMNNATAGAFVLSESYLYTAEMVEDALEHLTDQGVICTQFGELDYVRKPNRTTRYLVTARAAFSEEKIPDFSSHVLVASASGYPPFRDLVIVLGKKPFSDAAIWTFATSARASLDGMVHYLPRGPVDETPVNQVITLPDAELSKFLDGYRYEVTPVRDDAPFFWHFARFRDAIKAPLPSAILDHEDSIAEQITLTFLVVVVVLAALLLLVPLVTIRAAWAEMPHKRWAGAYFAALGLGFMFLEVGLIQKLTLLLGYPTYSLSVTLFALLVFSGLGSLLSTRFGTNRNRILATALGVLGAVVVLTELGLPSIVDACVGRALPIRIGVTVLLIAPIGLCLGTFMPLGLRAVSAISSRPREYVAWAWAVNGFFSVIASVLSTILGMIVGFRVLLLVALVVYFVGVLAMTRVPERRTADAP